MNRRMLEGGRGSVIGNGTGRFASIAARPLAASAALRNAFVGGSNLLAAAEKARPASGGAVGEFSVSQDIAFLVGIRGNHSAATKTPGAKAAKTGAFMALMVTDCYGPG